MNYEINQILEGIICNIKKFGLFIKIDNTNDVVFCHISNASNKFIKNIYDEFELNQKVSVKIIDIKNDKIEVTMKFEKPDNSFESLLQSYLKSADDKMNQINKRIKVHQK